MLERHYPHRVYIYNKFMSGFTFIGHKWKDQAVLLLIFERKMGENYSLLIRIFLMLVISL